MHTVAGADVRVRKRVEHISSPNLFWAVAFLAPRRKKGHGLRMGGSVQNPLVTQLQECLRNVTDVEVWVAFRRPADPIIEPVIVRRLARTPAGMRSLWADSEDVKQTVWCRLIDHDY